MTCRQQLSTCQEAVLISKYVYSRPTYLYTNIQTFDNVWLKTTVPRDNSERNKHSCACSTLHSTGESCCEFFNTYIHTHIHTYIHTIIHHYTPLYTQFWFISTFCCSQILHVPTVSAPRLPQLSHHQISHPGRWTGTAGPDPLKLMPFFGHALGSLIRRIVLPVEVQTIFPNIFFSGYGIRFPYPPCFSSLRSQTCQLIVGFGSPGR